MLCVQRIVLVIKEYTSHALRAVHHKVTALQLVTKDKLWIM